MKRELWLIWKQPEKRRRFKIGILTYEDNNYTFSYVDPELNDAIKNGFTFYPGFDNLNQKYISDELFSNIETRLPNPSRPDYLNILNSFNLDTDSTKFDILSATKGRLLTDNYEFVQPFNQAKIEFDIAGTRYCKDIQKCKDILKINDTLILEFEPDNQQDENAIKVILNKNGNKYHIGYVPRYYTKELSELLKKHVNYSAMIQKLNLESNFFDEDITAYVKIIFD